MIILPTKTELAKKYPETVKRYIQASNKALELIKNNPEKAMSVLEGKNYYVSRI